MAEINEGPTRYYTFSGRQSYWYLDSRAACRQGSVARCIGCFVGNWGHSGIMWRFVVGVDSDSLLTTTLFAKVIYSKPDVQ